MMAEKAHRGLEFAWRLLKFTSPKSRGKSLQVGVTAWTSRWSLGDKGRCHFGCSGVHVGVEDAIRQRGARSLGISDARLKGSDFTQFALQGGEKAAESLNVVNIRQGTGSDDLWKFLPTTGLCGSHNTDRRKQEPGTLAWISLINLDRQASSLCTD